MKAIKAAGKFLVTRISHMDHVVGVKAAQCWKTIQPSTRTHVSASHLVILFQVSLKSHLARVQEVRAVQKFLTVLQL